MLIISVLLWLIGSLILMSLIEYLSHRFPMHQKVFKKLPFLDAVFEKHVKFHHSRFYQDFDNEPDPVAKYINLDMNPILNTLGLAPIWLPLVIWVSPLAWIFAGIVFLHAIFWNIIHGEMHEPKGRWFSKFRLYKWYREYHKIHHERPSINFNVVLVGMDYLFGTYQRPELLDGA